MKQLHSSTDKMLEGLYEASEAVAATLGPHGANVYIEEPYGSRISNDGARIAYNIYFTDPQKNAGANIVKNAAAKTNDDVGDGTTTTVVFLKALLEEALDPTLVKDHSSIVRASLQEALKKAIGLLKKKSEPLLQENIEKTALVSSEYEDLAKIVSEITEKLGMDGMIAVGDSSTFETTYEITDGYEINSGFIAPGFMTDKKTQQAIYEDIPVFVAGKKVSKVQDIKKVVDILESKGIHKCVFFVADIEDLVTAVLVQSKIMGKFDAVVVRINKEMMQDIAAVTNANSFSDETGKPFNSAIFSDLGIAEKIICDVRTTLIMGDPASASKRALELEVDATGEDNDILKARLLERAARLRGKIAVIRVGANSDFAREHKKDKAQDVVKAIPAAAAEGLVAGGGGVWLEIADELGNNTIGEQILRRALQAPRNRLVASGVTEFNIKNPAKVERIALENAVEAAGIVLTLHALILEHKEDNRTPNS